MSDPIQVWITRSVLKLPVLGGGAIVKALAHEVPGKPGAIVVVSGTMRHQLLNFDWFLSEEEARKVAKKSIDEVIKASRMTIERFEELDLKVDDQTEAEENLTA